MRYKCIALQNNELWLTVGKVYDVTEGDINKYFPAADWLLIKKADDGKPCYSKKENFVRVEE